MNKVSIFEHPEFGRIRTLEIDGKIWFCASDVAAALGYSNPRDAVVRHCKPMGVVVYDTPTRSAVQKIKYISEGNVYRLIAGSKLPSAEKFESWIFDELVPETLKNGGYPVSYTHLDVYKRQHDDRFNAMVNKIALNKQKPNKQTDTPSVTIGRPGLGTNDGEAEAQQIENAEIARQLELRFGEIQDGMYAKLVEKCGDRLYWENWAKEVGLIAHKFIERISKLIQSGVHKKAFNEYLKGLRCV